MPLLSFTFTAPAQGEPGRVHQPAAVAAAEQIQRCSQCVGLHLSPAHQRLGRVLRIRCGETAIPSPPTPPLPLCSRGKNNVQCYPNVSDGQRFYPTSPLRDYTDTARRRTRRRSHSACVRFKDARATEEDVRNSKLGFGSLPMATVIFFPLVSSMLTSSLFRSFVLCLIFLDKAANDRQQRTNCLFNLQ